LAEGSRRGRRQINHIPGERATLDSVKQAGRKRNLVPLITATKVTDHAINSPRLFFGRLIRIKAPPDLRTRVPRKASRGFGRVQILKYLQLSFNPFELSTKPPRNQLIPRTRLAERISISLPAHWGIILVGSNPPCCSIIGLPGIPPGPDKPASSAPRRSQWVAHRSSWAGRWRVAGSPTGDVPTRRCQKTGRTTDFLIHGKGAEDDI
jgi:hypothetical protein